MFTNADIIKGNITNNEVLNQYAYDNGNPISNVDPFGLSAERGSSQNKKLSTFESIMRGAIAVHDSINETQDKIAKGIIDVGKKTGQTAWLTAKNVGKTVKNCMAFEFEGGVGFGAEATVGPINAGAMVNLAQSFGYNGYTGDGFYLESYGHSSYSLVFNVAKIVGFEASSSTHFDQWVIEEYGMLNAPEEYKDHTYSLQGTLWGKSYGKTTSEENGDWVDRNILSVGVGVYFIIGGGVNVSLDVDKADSIWSYNDYKKIWND